MKQIRLQKTRFKAWSSIWALMVILLITMLVGRLCKIIEIEKAQAQEVPALKSQVEELQERIAEYDTVVDPTSEQEQIMAEIKRVFGKHTPKAMLVLRGNNGGCSENWHLNPKATYKNTNGSTDYGVFQINDYWHGYRLDVKNKEMLMDWRVNIAMAWRLYENSGYSFRLWTCGKYWKI